eukprot:364950-Chlamydomonas_euryale.AAC.13
MQQHTEDCWRVGSWPVQQHTRDARTDESQAIRGYHRHPLDRATANARHVSVGQGATSGIGTQRRRPSTKHTHVRRRLTRGDLTQPGGLTGQVDHR